MNASPYTAEVSSFRKSKAEHQTTRGFGLRLPLSLRDRWVDRAPTIELELDGMGTFTVTLLDGFWNKCPEFMLDEVHPWIVSQGLDIPWERGKPHRFIMEGLSGTHFRVRRQG